MDRVRPEIRHVSVRTCVHAYMRAYCRALRYCPHRNHCTIDNLSGWRLRLYISRHLDMRVDMRVDICVSMCAGMCLDMRVDICVVMCVQTSVKTCCVAEECVDVCVDMRADKCMELV